MEHLKEWWQAIVALGGIAFAFVVGQRLNTWRVDQLSKDVEDIKGRVRALETQGTVEAVTLARIETQLTTLLTEIAELRKDLSGKVDK